MRGQLDALLREERVFNPDEELAENSNIRAWMDARGIGGYDELLERASSDPEWFWDEMASELEWFRPYTRVLEWEPPHARWFTGGKFNITYSALDRHVMGPERNRVAYIWEGEDGSVRKLTYYDLYREVNRLANALKDMGVSRGDRVSIYLPMIPELPIAMLACARIGAVHSVVFSGFWAKAFRERAADAGAKVAITADAFYRRGKVIRLKETLDMVADEIPSLERVIVVDRMGDDVSMVDGRDIYWSEAVEGMDDECPCQELDPEDPLFILYTSGTTGKPKGVVHTHGGYAVGVSSTYRFVFDVKDQDIWWCLADIGWITGHSYIVYAPLIEGATSVIYEGAPDHPDPGRIWSMVERYGVSILYTAPTTVRLFMKYGDKWPEKYDLRTLRILGSVGEPINPEAWMWYYRTVGGGRCPIMDTWWQTETGMHIITPLPVTPLKPGSAGKPFPTVIADVVDDEGRSLRGSGGHLVIKTPWPAMFRTLFREPERYVDAYWSTFPGIYLSGDVARIDEDGYFWIQGREDDVLNVAGHRISTAEVESALVSHPDVVEAAVVGKPDILRGEEIAAFVTLRDKVEPTPRLKGVLREHVRREIGPIASPSYIEFVEDLPKTRSGKIMRRVIKAIVRGEDVGDVSTLSNPESVSMLEDRVRTF
ncbi:acetate--CoA ligase [Methanothermobacter thermautotrophicus]|uniref:acetate--CoA ligase n=1 Tax=Methanothermobacter thermautotrophicus TaxID=145262 RepID=UPI0022B86A49|nr:acetate--CoA ligase [Methanothermobacter thermautotrophicus]WBF06098.1 acetate--CoA ligase [Methanothermobacter thermautotrophicus]